MTPNPNAAPAEPAASPPPPAGAGRGDLPEWTRLPIFLTAAAVAATLSLLSVQEIQYQIFVRTPIYLAPRGATEEQLLRERDSVRRRDLRMDSSALAASAALTAGLLGIAGGLCPPPIGEAVTLSRGRRVLRGAGTGLALGGGAGAVAAVGTYEILFSRTVAGWGGAAGDSQLFPAMLAYAVQLALIGAAAGIAVRLALGRTPQRSLLAAARGPILAGGSAGLVFGLLMPIGGVVLGSLMTNTFDARGFHRPVPLGRCEQAVMFFGFGALLALALARVSGRPADPVAAPAAA